MNYEVGKQYIMQVAGIHKDSAGYDYIALHDDDPNKEYRVYNILKCQYDNLPEQLRVVVKSIDAFGKMKLRQDEEWLNRQHYEEGSCRMAQQSCISGLCHTDTEYHYPVRQIGVQVRQRCIRYQQSGGLPEASEDEQRGNNEGNGRMDS